MWESLPEYAARRAYPVAQLEAAVRDFVTPKPEPGAKPAPKSNRKNWKPTELLPWYADFPGLGIPKEAQKDIEKNRKHMPRWALMLLEE